MRARKAKSYENEMPNYIAPMLAFPSYKPFNSEDWIFEIGYEGYRTIARVEGNHVDLVSNNNIPNNDLFAPIRKELMFLGFDCILDGEIVMLNNNGVPDRKLMQNYGQSKKGFLVFFVIDILYFQGKSVMELPLIHRKRILEAMPLPYGEQLQLCKHINGEGKDLFKTARNMGLQGITGKKSNSVYTSGKSPEWLKIKNKTVGDFIVVGYTTTTRKKHFGCLLIGYYQDGMLTYVGNVSRGFGAKVEQELAEKFLELRSSTQNNLTNLPNKYLKKEVIFLDPILVCKVEYDEVSPNAKMQHCYFKGLIEKEAKEIIEVK